MTACFFNPPPPFWEIGFPPSNHFILSVASSCAFLFPVPLPPPPPPPHLRVVFFFPFPRRVIPAAACTSGLLGSPQNFSCLIDKSQPLGRKPRHFFPSQDFSPKSSLVFRWRSRPTFPPFHRSFASPPLTFPLEFGPSQPAPPFFFPKLHMLCLPPQ